jgi:hypothetical protein
VGEYLLDNHRVLNAGDHFNGAAAFTARFECSNGREVSIDLKKKILEKCDIS